MPSVDDLEVAAAAAAAAMDEADMGGGLISSSNEDAEVQTLAVAGCSTLANFVCM